MPLFLFAKFEWSVSMRDSSIFKIYWFIYSSITASIHQIPYVFKKCELNYLIPLHLIKKRDYNSVSFKTNIYF